MTQITKPGIGRKFSRDEGWWRVYQSLKDNPPIRANILDTINYVEGKLVFRTIQAGTGMKIEILDADGFPPQTTPYTYLRISSTLQEGVNVTKGGSPIGSGPATTLDLGPGLSAVQLTPGTIQIINDGSVGSSNLIVYSSGVQVNTAPVQSLNFVSGAVVTETSAGHINIAISNLGGISLEDSGIPVSGGPFTTLNFVGASGLSIVTDLGGGVAQIDLGAVTGFNDITPFNFTYTGVTVTSGVFTVSAFFGTNTPQEKDILVMINGLVLEYNPTPVLSDFTVSGNNLNLNIPNIGYFLDTDDVITSYYWNYL